MRRLLCVSLALMVSALTAPAVTAAAAQCPSLAYVAAVQRAAHDIALTPPRISDARSQLVAATRVASPSPLVLTPVLDDLNQQPPATADASERLRQLSAVLAVPRGSTCHVDSSSARAALRNVYASPVFANLDQNTGPSVLDRILSFLGDLFQRIGHGLGVAGSIALGVVVIGGLLAFAAWRLRGLMAPRTPSTTAQLQPESDDPAVEWRAAEAAAAQHDYRQAVRRAFRSALLEIVRRDGVRFDSSWTTRDLLVSLSVEAELLTALAPAAASFDEAWYSQRPVTAQAWELARGRCEAVRTLASRGVRQPA